MTINRFNLNINNPLNLQAARQRANNPNLGIQHDLRDTYSVSARFNQFNSFLNANGITYSQYCNAKFEAQMASYEQKQLANQSAGQTLMSSIEGIFGGLKDIFGWGK